MPKFGKQEDGTFIIHRERLGELEKRVCKMVRRAAKTDTPPLTLMVREHGENRHTEGGRTCVFPWTRVSIEGAVPKISGFAFVARIEHHPNLGNIVSRAPGARELALPTRFRTASPKCEHCELARKRNDTFLLHWEEVDSYHQVGRNCLQDFLRTEDVANVLRLWSLLSQVECLLAGEGEGSGLAGRAYTATVDFLAAVCSSVRLDGWLSRTAARAEYKASTCDVAMRLCGRPPDGGEELAWWKSRQPLDVDHEQAAELMAWADGLGERDDLSDYHHNLRVAIAVGYVEPRNAGIVASALVAYKREREEEIKRQKKAARGPGCHIGQIGKRLTFSHLLVVRTRSLDGDWGSKTVVALEDEQGNDLVWFATGCKAYEPGDVLTGKGTVKDHEQYQGRPQTVLTRCALEKKAS
jgi:hypothetical protein